MKSSSREETSAAMFTFLSSLPREPTSPPSSAASLSPLISPSCLQPPLPPDTFPHLSLRLHTFCLCPPIHPPTLTTSAPHSWYSTVLAERLHSSAATRRGREGDMGGRDESASAFVLRCCRICLCGKRPRRRIVGVGWGGGGENKRKKKGKTEWRACVTCG